VPIKGTAKEKQRKITGAVDGQHYLFECSSCGALLADLWVNYPDDHFSWDFVALCDHCGGKSYQKTVTGMFALGQTEDSAQYSKVVDVNMDSDPIVIQTQKVKQYIP
jgi:hypothetical protein